MKNVMVDLRPLSFHADRCFSSVDVELEWGEKTRWIEAGAVSLHQENYARLEGISNGGITDMSHDDIRLFRLPLVGVSYRFTSCHRTYIEAYIDSTNPDDFRIPSASYQPEIAGDCLDERCRKPHKLARDFLPPHNPQLFNALRGKKVHINIAVLFPKESE